MKYVKATNSFGSGILGKDLRHRFDIPQYGQGLEDCTNFNITGIGAAHKRRGTEYCTDLSDSYTIGDTHERILIPYDYKGRNIFIELHGRFIYSDSSLGVTYKTKWYEDNGTISVLDCYDNNPENPISPAEYYVDYSGGKAHYAQIGIFLIVTHVSGNYEPIVFYLENDSMRLKTWTQFTDGIQYTTTGADTITWMPSNPDTTLTITVNETTNTATFSSLVTVYKGQYIRVSGSSPTVSTGVYKVTDTTNYPTINITTVISRGTNTTSYDWGLSSTSQGNWYKSVTVFNQRLILGGTPLAPNSVYCSAVGSPRFLKNLLLEQEYSITGEDTLQAFAIDLVGGVDVRFVYGANVLIIGTNIQPYVAKGVNGSFSPDSISVETTKALSCGYVQPTNTPKGVAFTDNARQKVYLGDYDSNTAMLNIVEVTVLNRDIKEKHLDTKDTFGLYDYSGVNSLQLETIYRFVWDSGEDVLITNMSSGIVANVVMLDEAKALGWYYSLYPDKIDRTYFDSVTQVVDKFNYGARCCSIIRLPSNGCKYYAFKRYKDNLTQDYDFTLERIRTLSSYDAVAGVYLDCHSLIPITSDGVTPQPVPARFIGKSELSYIRVTRNSKDTHEVGTLTIDANDEVIYPVATTDLFFLGIPYKATLRTLPLEAGGQYGASRGNIGRVHKATLSFTSSKDAVVSTDYDEEVVDMPQGLGWFSGDKNVDIPQSPDTVCSIEVSSSLPLACNVVGLTLHGVSYDE